jgi:hypothetical protein
VTESDWLIGTDPLEMLTFLRDRGPVSERKLRLFVVFCCRQLWPLLPDARSRAAVVAAERAADVDLAEGEREAVARAAHAVVVESRFLRPVLNLQAAWVAYSSIGPPRSYTPDEVIPVVLAFAHAERDAALLGEFPRRADELALAAAALRDLFGNPFHPVTFSPEWRTEAVVALARGIYEERAWDRMGVLADALDDAGCDRTDVLEHCRGPNVHVRGCWVVDGVLGKV